MGKLDRLRVTRRDDHTRADADFVEQLLRKAKGHPHAAVRGRISGQRPAVQRDAVPGDAQHVRHPGIVIEARAMVLVLLHDAEDAGWRLASRSSARHRRAQDPAVGVVDGHLLALDRYDRHDRLARVARGRLLGGMLGTGLAGRGVGGRSRSQRRQGGRGRERHNRGGCPSPDYLGGLGRRASICHAISRLSGRNRVETNTENGWMVPVLRPVVNQHFHVIGLLPADYFVRCMSRTMHSLRHQDARGVQICRGWVTPRGAPHTPLP